MYELILRHASIVYESSSGCLNGICSRCLLIIKQKFRTVAQSDDELTLEVKLEYLRNELFEANFQLTLIQFNVK